MNKLVSDLKNEKFIYFNSTEIIKSDIIWGLLELEVDVKVSEILVNIQDYNEEEVQNIEKEIEDCGVAVTQNFCITVAEACHRKRIPYISWVYDSPQRALFLKEALYDTNYIFMFDKNGIELLANQGIKHLYYLPLAANMAQTSMLDISDEDIQKYSSDISFVGSLYEKAYMTNFMENMPALIKTDFDKWFEDKRLRWGKGIRVFKDFPKSVIDLIIAGMNRNDLDRYNISLDYLAEILVGAYYLSSKERYDILNTLADIHETRLYTTNQNLPGIRAKIFPPVNYEDEMYKVFFASKINLNITYRGIETGVPQRIFDIMSVGGFVLTNYQEEIEDLFEIGTDLQVYYDLDDLKNKVDYYLAHENERVRIGINGYQKVKDIYNYTNSLNIIFDIVERDMFE